MTVIGWKSRTWGTTASDVMVLGLPGIEDRALKAANGTGGRDGGFAAPAFSDIGSFIADLVVLADSNADMAAKLRDLYSVTWGDEDPTAEHPFTFTIAGQPERTVFARVTNRHPATDFTTRARFAANRIPVAFEATDPMVYEEAVSTVLAPGESLTIDQGWAPTLRWTFSVTGAVGKPRLLVETEGYPDQTVRYNANLAGGQLLVVESLPEALRARRDGANVYGTFDAGTDDTLARFPKLLPGQTATFLADSGTAPATLTYWPATP